MPTRPEHITLAANELCRYWKDDIDWDDAVDQVEAIFGRLSKAGFHVVREGEAVRDRVWELKKLDGVERPDGRMGYVYCLEPRPEDLVLD